MSDVQVGQWSVNPATHSLEWIIPLVSQTPGEDGAPCQPTGNLEFNVGGEEPDAFFPVTVSFVGVGSLLGLEVCRLILGEGKLYNSIFSDDIGHSRRKWRGRVVLARKHLEHKRLPGRLNLLSCRYIDYIF